MKLNTKEKNNYNLTDNIIKSFPKILSNLKNKQIIKTKEKILL